MKFEAKYYNPRLDTDEVMVIDIDDSVITTTSDIGYWKAALHKFFGMADGCDLIEMKMISG